METSHLQPLYLNSINVDPVEVDHDQEAPETSALTLSPEDSPELVEEEIEDPEPKKRRRGRPAKVK